MSLASCLNYPVPALVVITSWGRRLTLLRSIRRLIEVRGEAPLFESEVSIEIANRSIVINILELTRSRGFFLIVNVLCF